MNVQFKIMEYHVKGLMNETSTKNGKTSHIYDFSIWLHLPMDAPRQDQTLSLLEKKLQCLTSLQYIYIYA